MSHTPNMRAAMTAVVLTTTALVGVATLAAPAAAATITVTATADTYTREDAATTNYGTAVRFSAQGNTGYRRMSLVRFPISVPDGQQLTKAEVMLTVDGGTTTTGGVDLFTTDATWTETGATWNNQPAALLALGRKAPLPVGSVQTWDVTTVVPRTGTGSLNLKLSTADSGWFGFQSREASGGKPVLVLTTEPVPTSTTSTTTTTTTPPTTTATATATADTYTREDAATTNYGTAVRFSAQGKTRQQRTSLVRFPIFVPTGQQLTKAEVKLTVDGGTKTTGGVDLFTTDATWTETGATWNNQPAALLALGRKAPLPVGSVQTWDVTTVVPRTGTGSLNLKLSTADSGWFGFQSREASGGKPVLVLTTEPVPTSTATTTTTTTTPPTTTTTTTTPPSTSDDGTQAAVVRGWGSVVAGDEFSTGTVPDGTKWSLYNSAGHNGQGIRSPAAWSVQDGYARVSGDAAGTTGGMSAKYAGADRQLGRWEVRVRASDVEPKYHPVGILWPTSGNWPCDGEIDFVEKPGSSTGEVGFYNHYSCANSQTTIKRAIDWSQWHNYAVEWTSLGVVGYLDGVEWFRDNDTSHLPPGPMHQTLQLDWFPVSGQTTNPSTFDIAWVRQYDLTTSTATTTTTTTTAPTTTTTTTTAPGDVRLAAVGDMNGGGSYSTTSASGKNASSIKAALTSGDVSAFLGLGDFQYDVAYCADYLNYWNKAGWAGVKPYTYWISAPNHDYQPGRNTDLATFMDGRCTGDTTRSLTNVEKGSIGDTTPYSFDKGKWHIAALSTALWRYDVAGANAATVWLDADLAAAKARGQHLIVMYHDPYFTSNTSSHTRATEVKPWVDVIDKYDVRLTLSGSQHNYERSCPVLANDTCTADNGTGTTAFQVSTGGQTLRAFTSSPSYIVARQSTTHGWLRLVLHPDGSFAWTFVPTNGTFTESGTRPAIGG